MRNSVKWASGSASIRSETVGPRHDPYCRTIVDLTVRGKDYTLVDCALAGMWIECDGVKLASAAILDKEAETHFAEAVEALTGFDPFYWTDTIWARVNKARYKVNPEFYEMDRAYEAAYGNYV